MREREGRAKGEEQRGGGKGGKREGKGRGKGGKEK